MLLKWRHDDDGVYRATGDDALYVISQDDNGRFLVGYFPSPGPECRWGEPHHSLEAAIVAADLCASHVRKIFSETHFRRQSN